MTLYAHSKPDAPRDEWQTLEAHLDSVADLCSEFASSFGCKNWGRAIGALHDVGKASKAFQKRLTGSSERVDHSTGGAREAQLFNGNERKLPFGTLMSFVIAGHHGGIPNGNKKSEHNGRAPLYERLSSAQLEDYSAFQKLFVQGNVSIPDIDQLEDYAALRKAIEGGLTDDAREREHFFFATTFFTRMLFSCLVDADYLDTESFMLPDYSAARNRDYASLPELLSLLENYMNALQAGTSDSSVNAARKTVLDDACAASAFPTGIFTMTVPTGGGKTLASMMFALRHAVEHGLRRVIVAIPYTSIVEQTASVLREVFGNENVLEHHSNYDFEARDEESVLSERLAVQNWDAPIIVTTNVQLLGSLYSNKPGKCRKLHNVVGSVLVLDEAQTLPDSLLTPSLAALEELTLDYGCTVVLCTATQPAIANHWPFGSHTQEIAKHQEALVLSYGQSLRQHRVLPCPFLARYDGWRPGVRLPIREETLAHKTGRAQVHRTIGKHDLQVNEVAHPVAASRERVDLLGHLVLQCHERHLPRRGKSEVRERLGGVDEFYPVGGLGIANLIVADFERYRAPRLSEVGEPDVERPHDVVV